MKERAQDFVIWEKIVVPVMTLRFPLAICNRVPNGDNGMSGRLVHRVVSARCRVFERVLASDLVSDHKLNTNTASYQRALNGQYGVNGRSVQHPVVLVLSSVDDCVKMAINVKVLMLMRSDVIL